MESGQQEIDGSDKAFARMLSEFRNQCPQSIHSLIEKINFVKQIKRSLLMWFGYTRDDEALPTILTTILKLTDLHRNRVDILIERRKHKLEQRKQSLAGTCSEVTPRSCRRDHSSSDLSDEKEREQNTDTEMHQPMSKLACMADSRAFTKLRVMNQIRMLNQPYEIPQ